MGFHLRPVGAALKRVNNCVNPGGARISSVKNGRPVNPAGYNVP